MIVIMPLVDKPQQTIEAQCPSCGAIDSFHFIGVQEWPESVAKRLNVAQKINLYQCPNCRTTISEMLLLEPDSDE